MRGLKHLWQKVTALVAVEVPAEVAACEFDCHELNCEERQWATCPRRVSKSEAIADLARSTSPANVE